MGIPKFFRYISERYPLTSQLIEENKIPEFDNLYLDFNGIIHSCSHPNDEDAHFRLTEEQIFTSIFAYVEHLFSKIKPKKLFFMAVDGVAPRAKMNQQRSRRFRTAKEAREVREKAERRGEKLPDEKAFDSNCITPGTTFMAKLSAQMRYFINKKITEDSNWQSIEVVFSGHDVPGEGEHKIMEYIRLSRAQPDYNPNVRHCLYGLDADLIMLGLLSHDPHFCLLREEVKFGPARKSKSNDSLETRNFYLLHLTLMREYLDLEFNDIAPVLPFDYNLERVIDDFILLAVFVGNDFLPNLPDLHIHENGLERLFEVYKKILPSLDGYVNESGVINTKRLQRVLDEMKEWELEIFQKEYADINWFKGKQTKHVKEIEAAKTRAGLTLTPSQRDLFDKVKNFVIQHRNADRTTIRNAVLQFPNTFPARDRKFIEELSGDLHLCLSWDEYDENDENLVTIRMPGALEEPVPVDQEVPNGASHAPDEEGAANADDDDEAAWEDEEEEGEGEEDEDEEDEEDEAESNEAVDRILRKYEKAKVVDPGADGGFDARYEMSMKQKMDEWKREYYKHKLEISYDNPEQMHALIYRYVEGLQWVMHYYYSGVASWSWFYDYHYAPRISDLTGIDEMTFHFELGKPFRPFEQLMGVLPEASKELIPLAYRDLMYDPTSPILDFYPLEFEQDLNGKKQDWEAVVKIPFIDEQRLLKAMAPREPRLTEEERQRNSFGTSYRFTHSDGEPTEYPSSLPGFFPTLHRCTCRMEPFYLPTIDGLHLVPGLLEGVRLGAEALAGFPSLKTLPHTAQLGYHGVNVHGSESRNKSMIVHIQNTHEEKKTEAVAQEMIGKRVFIGWPFLREGLVVAVSDSLFKYEKMTVVPGAPKKVVSNPHSQQGLSMWRGKADRIEHYYSKRCGVITGDIEVLIHVRPLKGLKRLDSGAFVKAFEDGDKEVEQVLQMAVTEVMSEDPRFMEKEAPPLSEEFPEGSKVFFLGEHAYGVAAQITGTTQDSLSVVLAFFPSDKAENEEFKSVVRNRMSERYYPSFNVAEIVGASSKAIAKITSSFMVITSDGQKVNLGLSLKFEAKGMKVIDYSRKNGRFWEFSEKAVQLIRDYKAKAPEVFRAVERSGDAMTKAYDVFSGEDSDKKVKDLRTWLATKGVRDFEPVSLFCDQLKKETVKEIEGLQAKFTEGRSPSAIKKAIVKGIPRQAVLKPSHAVYRLQNQRFGLGDRVTMVRDSGSVPLSAKGVVIALNAKSMDVVWDVPFMAGTTLGGRCSPYRGSTVEFNTCLNLTDPQYVASTKPRGPPPHQPQVPFKPRFGPYPAVRPPPGQAPVGGFHPAPAGASRGSSVQILANPNRGRGAYVNGRGTHTNGRGAPPHAANGAHVVPAQARPAMAGSPPVSVNGVNGEANHLPPVASRGGFVPPHPRGFAPRGGRGFSPNFRGRGGMPPVIDRGRGGPFRGPRGRGRGAPPVAS